MVLLLPLNYIVSEENISTGNVSGNKQNTVTDNSSDNIKALGNNLSKEFILKKISGYKFMKNTGAFFTFLGTSSLVTSLILGTLDHYNYINLPGDFPVSVTMHSFYYSHHRIRSRKTTYNFTTNSVLVSLDAGGLIMLAVGIPLLAAGAGMTNKYENILKTLSMSKIKPVVAYDEAGNDVMIGLNVKI